MTSLTEQCLASINRINTLYSDGNNEINKTIAEFCDKCDIMFNLSNSAVVMENWWEKDPNESKLVTFFMFIPRLFRQIIQYLKDIFNQIRYKLMTPFQKEMYDMLTSSDVDRFNKYANDPEHIMGIANDDGTAEVNFKTRLRSADTILGYIDKARAIFLTLKEGMVSYSSDLNGFNELSAALLELNTSRFSDMFTPAPEWISEKELFEGSGGYNPTDRNSFKDYLNHLSQKIDDVKKEIDGALSAAGQLKDQDTANGGVGTAGFANHADINFVQIQNHFRDMQKNFIELGKEVQYLYGLQRKKIYALEKLDEDLIKTKLIADGKLKLF